MMSEWQTMPIKEVYIGMYDGPHATPKPSESGPIFLGIKNVGENGQLDLSNARLISEGEYPRWIKRVKPLYGDIVFSYEATLNRYAIIPRNFRGCLGRRMALIRPDESKICGRFLFYYFFGQEWQAVIAQNTLSGSTVDRIPISQLPDFPITVPSIPTQQKIATILSAYDDLIENNLRRIKILEEMAQNLYREWFVKFRFPGHKQAQFIDSSLGMIPKGWKVKMLGSLIAEHIGGGWGNDVDDDRHTEQAWVIRGTDIPDARFCNFLKVPLRYHTKSNLKSRRLIPGDIVFEVSSGSKGQPLGRSLYISPELLAAFNGDPVICASFCKRIQPDSDQYASELLYLSFLDAYASGEIEQYQVQSTGISNYKWSDYLEKVSRCVPPIALQNRFCELSVPLFSEIATLGRKNTTLRRTRDLFLPKLISGEVDVSELDIAVPEETES